MSYTHLTWVEEMKTPCLFIPSWSVARCDHAICKNRIARRSHLKRKAGTSVS